MGHQDNRFARIPLDLRKEIVAFALECLVPHSKHLVKHKDIPLGFDGNRERKPYLHAGRIIFKLLVHEFFKLGEFNDIIVHTVNFPAREAQQRTVQIYIFTPRQLRVETDAKLNERHEFTRNRDLTLFRIVYLGNDLKERRFPAAVTPDDTEELALVDIKTDIFKDFLPCIAFDAFCPVDERLLDAGRLLSRQFE